MSNNGYKKYHKLVQYDACTNQPTGIVKPNLPSDPDYVAPVFDPVFCPVPTTTSTTTTTVNTASVAVTLTSAVSEIKAIKNNSVIDTTSSSGTWNIPNYIYDSIIFVIAVTQQSTLTITYNGGQVSTITAFMDSLWEVMLPGAFPNITAITVS